ncbi:MAG: DEAD/DEAH box helicase, partial [Epsilonproteobacteria bacterium]|nr:DEAD/DEAH box helicase [Campylobacterota bacterium]
MIKSDTDPIEAERLKKLGVQTLLDLALIVPHSYDNTYLSSAPLLEQNNTLHVKVLSIKRSPKVLQMLLFCEAWNMQLDGVIFAPKPYQKALFKQGIDCFVSGKISYKNGRLQLLQPRSVTQINQLIPKYKTPLQNKTVLELMKRHLNLEALLHEGLAVNEAKILLSLHVPSLHAVYAFEKEGYSSEVKQCLKFVEIYNDLKKLSGKKVTFPSCAKLEGDERSFIASLPFTLTADQQKVIGEIKRDFLGNYATKRVVMGDVGCGKTMVILSAVMMAYPKKVVLMAPTTVLARQLFEEARKFLPLHVKSVLVTQESDVKENLEAFDFMIGTHAL